MESQLHAVKIERHECFQFFIIYKKDKQRHCEHNTNNATHSVKPHSYVRKGDRVSNAFPTS